MQDSSQTQGDVASLFRIEETNDGQTHTLSLNERLFKQKLNKLFEHPQSTGQSPRGASSSLLSAEHHKHYRDPSLSPRNRKQSSIRIISPSGKGNTATKLPTKSLSTNDVNERKYFQYLNSSKRLTQVPLETRKKCVLDPNTKWKIRWDLVNLVLVLFIGINTPYRIAFEDNDSLLWLGIECAIDMFFFADIILTFFSAYYNKRDELVINRRKIACSYMKGWFFLDVVMVLPISLVFKTAEYNKLMRLARLSRVYRLLRILRLMKFIKERKKFKKHIMHFSSGAQRLATIIVVFLLACHTASCMWYFIAKMVDFDPECWVSRNGYLDASVGQLYLAGIYFSIATFTTVGYGDIAARNPYEMCFSCVLMVFGVISYSLLIGSLSSMIQSIDISEKALLEKLHTLEIIRKDYNLDFSLYWKLRQSLQYDFQQDRADKHTLLKELPANLRVELSNVMFQNMVEGIEFFKKKSPHFIASVGPRLRQIRVAEGEFVFKQGYPLDAIYFLKQGTAAYVDAKQEGHDLYFAEIPVGRLFGEIEFTHSTPDQEAKRIYSVKAVTPIQLLVLEKQHLYNFDNQFTEEVLSLFQRAPFKHEKLQRLKREAKMLKDSISSEGEDNEMCKSSEIPEAHKHINRQICLSGLLRRTTTQQIIGSLKPMKQVPAETLFDDQSAESPFKDDTPPLQFQDFTEPSNAQKDRKPYPPSQPMKHTQSFLDVPTPLLQLACRSGSLGLNPNIKGRIKPGFLKEQQSEDRLLSESNTFAHPTHEDEQVLK